MRPELLRAILQGICLLLFMPVLFFFGAGCLCVGCGAPTGSDEGGGSPELAAQTRETLVGEGTVFRSHFMQDGQLIASAGEAQVFKQALPDAFVGLLLPSAPGASQPGQLQDGANVMQGTVATPVLLRQDRTQAARLTALFPPASGTQWAALVVSDTQMLDSLLSGPINLDSLFASFNYAIDFGGTNPCNGCEVKVVGCAPGQFAAFLPPGLVTVRTAGQGAAALPLACTQPVSTYIMLDNLPGAPLVAAFGLWGSLPTTSTINGAVILPVNLEHTGQTTLTFDLAPIQSALGWSYNWTDSQGTAITQIAVPRRNPFGPPPPPNLRVTATGLPTCTRAVDALMLRATNTVTPSIAAQTQASIVILPDPARCPVADVAAYHVQETAVISGSDRLTYTLSISNLLGVDVPGVITQTLSPGAAVRGAVLPGGCTIAGNVVTCQVGDVPAQGAKAVTVAILGAPGYSGDLNSIIKVDPAGASDPAFLDNVHGPLVAAVNFAIASFPLSVTKSGAGSGVVTSTPTGIDCGSDCGNDYVAGTVVTLTAAADGGSTFVDWQGACTGASPVCSVTMDAAKVTTATFALVPVNYPLTVTKSGAGSGVVTSTPAGIDCGADCGESYLAGTVVTLTAAATSGSTFVDWQGACTGASPVCSVTMDAAKVTTATFALVPVNYPLTVTKSGAGSGVVTSTPAGIDCGADCGESYLAGTVVTLTATATSGSTFVDWQGACTGASPVCSVTMDAAKVTTATFALVPVNYPLTVTKSGAGSGVVTSTPAGIDCGADCGESYLAGTVVTLTAAATSGSTFVDWQGACTGASPVCSVTMDAAKVTTATFALVPVNYPLTVIKSGAGSGVVTSAPAGIDCGADCEESYVAGTVVTLTAAAEAVSGSTFVDWQGACTGANPYCPVTMDAAKVTTATFALAAGSITIVKIAERGNATFEFVSAQLGNFALTTVGGTASRTFSPLQPGVYSVAEIAPTGWQTSTVICTNGSDPASINLAQGQSVTCTFTSQPSPTDLPEGEEPTLNQRLHLPLINR